MNVYQIIMEKHCITKFYRVGKDDTAVTEVSFNDFRLIHLKGKEYLATIHTYSLPAGKEMYYGYEQKQHAMEMAKAGAIKHIEKLEAEGAAGIDKIYKYRFDHYVDLNVNLTELAIRKLVTKQKQKL